MAEPFLGNQFTLHITLQARCFHLLCHHKNVSHLDQYGNVAPCVDWSYNYTVPLLETVIPCTLFVVEVLCQFPLNLELDFWEYKNSCFFLKLRFIEE